jgi:hypothetical protein
VAFARLSPAVLARIRAIRATDISVSYDHMDSRTHQLRHENCRADTVEQLANWADCVRYSPDAAYNGTAPYHFDDIPWCGPPPPRAAYCANDACGSAALQHYVAQLRDPNASARDRAIALAFVIHIVGDLQQPLHTIDNHDGGGNNVSITVAPDIIPGNRRFANLHSLWDGGIVAAAFPPSAQADNVVAALAARNARSYRHGAASEDASHAQRWVQEAHAIAVQAYDRLPTRPQCNPPGANGGTITAAYVSRFTGPVRRQLARGAVRLADVLSAALG